MDPSIRVGEKPRLGSKRMRKACDNCRRSKIKCEKPDNFPSCTACYQKSLACIISQAEPPADLPFLENFYGLSHPTFPPATPTADHALSSTLSFKQWTRGFVYNWIYTHEPPSNVQDLPASWRALIYSQLGGNVRLIEEGLSRARAAGSTTLGKHSPQRTVFLALPPDEEIRDTLLTFSRCTSGMLPLFLEEIPLWIADSTELKAKLQDTSSWAALNVALAIGYKFHSLWHPECQNSDQKSKKHLKNALATVSELLLSDTPTLLTVQVLLGIVFLVQNSLEVPIYQNLLSVAIRLSQTIGLHRSDLDGSSPQHAQRVCVFWIGYIMDKTTCFMQGLVPCDDDNDNDVALPGPSVLDKLGYFTFPDGQRLSLFRLACELAIIRHKIYKTLYSTNSVYLNNTKFQSSVRDLGLQLTTWRRVLSPDCEAYLQLTNSNDRCNRFILRTLILCYHNSVISLYQRSLFFRATPHFGEIDASRQTWTALCLYSSRLTASLLRYDASLDSLGVRNIISFAMGCFMILFMHILEDPRDSMVHEDFAHLQFLSNYISNLVQQGSTSTSPQYRENMLMLVRLCEGCEGLARRAMQKAGIWPPGH